MLRSLPRHDMRQKNEDRLSQTLHGHMTPPCHVLIALRDPVCVSTQCGFHGKLRTQYKVLKTLAWHPRQDGCFSSFFCFFFLGRRPFLSLHVGRCFLCFSFSMAWRLFDVAMPFLQASHRHGDAPSKTATMLKNDSGEREKGPVNEFNCWGENGRRLSFVQPECEGKAGGKKSSRFQSAWGVPSQPKSKELLGKSGTFRIKINPEMFCTSEVSVCEED